MSNEQINVPSLVAILVLSGLVIRYFFFSSPPSNAPPRDSMAAARSREAAAERILQMFPQVDRRTVLWDLQRNGGNIAATTERILAGRMETPPITFQPPPPPGSAAAATAGNSTRTQQQQSATAKTPAKPAQPDLITRYNLKDKVAATPVESSESSESTTAMGGQGGKGTKAWSSNREERQTLLQKRRDQMILEARRKMEAKIAAEKASSGSS
ncbi:ubiquitin system component cue domain-containing protein [Podospora didyma]|uniref:Coupling of ubiquitin conjugation to ER degradation protein 1 n=1 Tax=Podospora didyma TaxID=330526 RepID=A0AAE0P020_9PEZI|nr:ubiquitin system component cue domain-containing protein [Podospora didyma]